MANAAAASFDDDLNVDEFSNIDCSLLLMSLLEDSPVEDGDDEMLRSMIESLEPEIMSHESCSETDNSDDASLEDFRFSEVDDQLESCSISPDHHPEFEWIDMEMAEEMTGYFVGRFAENMVELEGLEDYSQACYGLMSMDEDDYIGLWQ